MRLLENDGLTLEDAGFRDEDSLLVKKTFILAIKQQIFQVFKKKTFNLVIFSVKNRRFRDEDR